jgi:hypothetical protein
MAENRRPTGLIFLLIYQWILVLIALGTTIFVASWFRLECTLEGGIGCVFLVVPSCFGTAMAVASIGIICRKSWAFLLGMICHLVLEVIGWSFVLILLGTPAYIQMTTSDRWSRSVADLYVVFAIMCLPLNVPSAWAFLYLRRRRTANVGGAVAMEVVCGFCNIFGIGHFMNGNAGLGLLFMFGYWYLQTINVCLLFVAIGFFTLPLTWLCFIIISPITVANAPPRMME